MELTGEPEVACLRTESVTYWMKKTNVARCAITLHKYTTTYGTNVYSAMTESSWYNSLRLLACMRAYH